jgi:hypothetical protein
MALVNSPFPLPSVVLLSAMVGLSLVDQHTPLAETGSPPSEVIVPPPVAVVNVVFVMLVVVTTGAAGGLSFLQLWIDIEKITIAVIVINNEILLMI